MTYPFLTPLASCHPGIEDTIFKFVSICSLGIAESAATKPRRYHPARADLATACASASTKVRLASLRTIEKLNKPRTQQALFEPLETKHRRESTFERTSVTETQLQDCQIKCARAEMDTSLLRLQLLLLLLYASSGFIVPYLKLMITTPWTATSRAASSTRAT